jgi:malate synthase
MANQSYTLSQPLDDRTASVLTPNDGTAINASYFKQQLEHIAKGIRATSGEDADAQHYPVAAKLLSELVLDDNFVEFLTLPAYELIN